MQVERTAVKDTNIALDTRYNSFELIYLNDDEVLFLFVLLLFMRLCSRYNIYGILFYSMSSSSGSSGRQWKWVKNRVPVGKKWDKFHTLIYGHLVIYHRWNGKTLLKHGSKTRGRFWYLENWQDYRNVFTFHHNPLEAKLQMIEQKMSTLSQSIISLGIFPPWLHAWWVIFPVLQVVTAISSRTTLGVITLDR